LILREGAMSQHDNYESPGAGLIQVGLVTMLMLAGAVGCAPQRAAAARTTFPSLVLQSERRMIRPAPEPVQPKPTKGPNMFDRRDWYASPTRANHDPMGRITRITIHHMGMGVEEEVPVEDVKAKLRLIQKSHQNYRHWADIGYHFIIDPSGNVWEGRPLAYQGAHAGNNSANKGNIGICVMGNYDLQKPTSAQISTLRWLVCDLMERYDIPITRVYTHKEISEAYGLGTTDCPGRYLQREVDAMRRRIAEAGKPK